MSLGKAVNHAVPQFPHLASGGEDATFLEGCRWGLSGIIQRAVPRLLGLPLSERGPSVLLPAGLSKDHAHPCEPRVHTYLPLVLRQPWEEGQLPYTLPGPGVLRAPTSPVALKKWSATSDFKEHSLERKGQRGLPGGGGQPWATQPLSPSARSQADPPFCRLFLSSPNL